MSLIQQGTLKIQHNFLLEFFQEVFINKHYYYLYTVKIIPALFT